MKKVVSSSVVKEFASEVKDAGFDSSLVKVEQTASYRCPGCFEYTLTFRRVTFGGQIDLVKKVETKLVSFESGEILVEEKI